MAKESKSGGMYDESSKFKTMPIGETQLQVLTADSTKAAISKIAKENDKANKSLIKSIEELSRTVEVLSKASNKVGLDQSYRLLREDLSTIVSRAGWGKEGVDKEDKEFFKILEKFVSGSHTTPRKDDGREPGKAVEKEDLKSFEDHIARLLKDSAFSDINKALPKGVIEGINKEKDEAKDLFDWNKGLSKFLEDTGQGERAEKLRASADSNFDFYKQHISDVFNKLNELGRLNEFGGFKNYLSNTSNGEGDDVLAPVERDSDAPSQEQIVREQWEAQGSENKRTRRSNVDKGTTTAEGESKVVKGTTTDEGESKKKDANTTLAEAVRTLFDRYLNTRIATQEKQKIVDYAKENPDKMDNDFFLKVAKSSDELSKYLKNPEGGRVRDFEKILKDSIVGVLNDTTTAPSKEKAPAPSKVKENAKKIVEKATTPDLTQTSLLDFIPKEKSTSEVEGGPGPSSITPQNMLDINGMLKEAVSNIETSLIDMLDRTGNEFAKYMQNAMDNLSSMFSGGEDLIHDSGSSGESSSYSSSKESKGQRAKTESPSDTSPKPPFRDAISKIIAREPRSPINSIGRVTSLFPDILARKDDGPINQKEKMDRLRKSITDKKGEPEPELGLFADIMKRLTESMSNLKTQVWPKDEDGQPKNLREATKDAFDTTSKEREEARADSPFAKAFDFIDNVKFNPIGTFRVIGKNITKMLTDDDEDEPGGLAKGLGAMTSAIGIVIELVKKLVETSPILKAVLELFNLAFTLFMMPFGNMIGEWLLPLAMGLIDLAVKFNEIFPKIREVFAGIGEWVLRIPEMIGEKVIELGAKIVEGLTGVKDYIVEKLTDVKDYILGLPEKIGEKLTELKEKLVGVLTGIKEYILDLPKKIGDKLKELKDKIVEKLTDAKEYIVGLPKKIWESLKDGATHLTTAIKNAVKGFFDKPKEYVDKAKNAIGGIGDSVKGFFGFAGGGYVPASPGGSIVRVGEGTRGEYIIPEGSSMLGSSGGQTINITFSGNVYGMRDFEDRVAEIVNKTSNKAHYR